MSRDVFTIVTTWERRDGLPWLQATTHFVHREPTVDEYKPLEPETRDMTDDEVAEVVLQGVALGAHMIESVFPLRYVTPEEFAQLRGESS